LWNPSTLARIASFPERLRFAVEVLDSHQGGEAGTPCGMLLAKAGGGRSLRDSKHILTRISVF
jgi:hypothetical protein